MEMDFSDLNWFDIAVLSTVFISTIFAFFRGFIKAFFSLITWAGAGIITFSAYSYVHEFLSSYISGEKALMASASIGTFFLSFLFIAIFTSKIIFVLRRQRGGIIDRTLGLLFGLARGALVVGLIFFSIHMTAKMLQMGDEKKPGPDWFVNAKTYNSLFIATTTTMEALPQSFTDDFIAYIDKIKEISLSVAQDNLGMPEGNPQPRMLDDNEREIMKQIISTLPREDLNRIYDRYEGSASEISELEKMSIFREILSIYGKNAASGKLKESQKISKEQWKALNKALNPGLKVEGYNIPPDEGKGYEKKNLMDMDRLINTVDE